MKYDMPAHIRLSLIGVLLFSLVACDSNTSSNSTPDLNITPSMRSECPDTTGIGLKKIIVAADYTYSTECSTWLYNDEGYLTLEWHSEEGCSNAPLSNPAFEKYRNQSGDQSGYYYLKTEVINTIYYNNAETVDSTVITHCIYIQDQHL
jgi:hypothetical protein